MLLLISMNTEGRHVAMYRATQRHLTNTKHPSNMSDVRTESVRNAVHARRKGMWRTIICHHIFDKRVRSCNDDDDRHILQTDAQRPFSLLLRFRESYLRYAAISLLLRARLPQCWRWWRHTILDVWMRTLHTSRRWSWRSRSRQI